MTLDTEQRIEPTPPVETRAKPPPRLEEEPSDRLFQTMYELYRRHGTAPGTERRVLHTVVALMGGALASLYAVILVLE